MRSSTSVQGRGPRRWTDGPSPRSATSDATESRAYMMTEYIPATARDTFTHWGTDVWSAPAH
ncbi:MAG TPA: hypothetical protein VIM19_20485 [Actinomycetes bacterium]